MQRQFNNYAGIKTMDEKTRILENMLEITKAPSFERLQKSDFMREKIEELLRIKDKDLFGEAKKQLVFRLCWCLSAATPTKNNFFAFVGV